MATKFSIDTFSKTAQKLARNPLGIIALFIVLVYGIAGLVLSSSISNLVGAERWPLIIFLVTFPVLVLAAFLWLVTCHHTKLYAPDDFPDKEGFFRALTTAEQKQKLDEEVNLAQEESSHSAPTSKERSELRSKIALVEELALREIEKEYNVIIQRQAGLVGGGCVDGAFIDSDGRRIAVEIKYTQKDDWRWIVEQAKKIPGLIESNSLDSRMPLLLVIVTEGISKSGIEQAVERVMPMLGSAPYSIAIKLFDFGELKKKYGFTEQEEE